MKKLFLLCIPMLLIFLAGCEYENPIGYMGLLEKERPVLQILSDLKGLVLDTSFDVECAVDDRFGLKELTVAIDRTVITKISNIEPGILKVRIDIKYLNDGNNTLKFFLTDASGNSTFQELSVSVLKRKVVMSSEGFSVLSELNKGMNKLLTDKQGRLWIYHSTYVGGTGDRSRLFKITQGAIEEINVESLNSVSIVGLQIDSKGNPWLLSGTNHP